MESIAPNAVPPRQSSYLDLYHLTQLGLATPDPTQSNDHNPLVDGKEASGPQGFLCYCKDIDNLPTPVDSPKGSPPQHDNKRISVLNGGGGDRKSKPVERQSVRKDKEKSNPNVDRAGGAAPDRNSRHIKVCVVDIEQALTLSKESNKEEE